MQNNVLLVGSGGREHAIAWKLAQSPLLGKLWAAPGNPGIAQYAENAPIAVEDVPALVDFARQKQIDLVVVGPEAALAAGLSDALAAAGIAVFGPSRQAARLETSKAFAKQFMQRVGIPSARFAVFDRIEPALHHLDAVDYPIVIKASGLAAGKGVILPEGKEEAQEALRLILVEQRFGHAGDQVIIEERLQGEEVSLLAFTDGINLALMPPAQDHKCLLDGDRGPNTGGMGAYAPAPVCPPALQAALVRDVLQPAIDGLRREGMPFVGVIYAGMMLTPQGPRVLEFNARFGDPETQAILPLLESDLLEILLACTRQELAGLDIRWQQRSAVCVVMASAGYPEKSSSPTPISGLEAAPLGSLVFHAGTAQKDGRLLASGGRVLGVTASADDLPQAIQAAYRAVDCIHFEGAQYRGDIAQKVPRGAGPAYSQAGVDIAAGNRAVELMVSALQSTYDRRVLSGVGAFGGLFDATELQKMHAPVLVASTDGVGTKVKLAAALGRYQSIGMDIVNHCIDDILVQGARPLFFLDYFATSHLKPEVVAEIVAGAAAACRQAGCILIGGETAEMPGVYRDGEFDLAGTIVGCVEREHLLPRPDIHPGDRLIGIASSGPHTNGYSLLRRIFAEADLQETLPGSSVTLGEALLAPHRSYLELLQPMIVTAQAPIKALAHITGGGFIDNLPRVLPRGLGARVERSAWNVPPLFRLAQQRGQIGDAEMYRVFNMGIGMVIVADSQAVAAIQAAIPEQTWVIGDIIADEAHQVTLL